jgi:predicted Zn-ribbon and HTH transcriptional regulator
MSLSILSLADELAIIKCMLTYDRDPLAMLGLRQHFIDYHLDSKAPDAFFLGEVKNGIVTKMMTVTIRGSETVLRKPQAQVTPDDFTEALVFCKHNAENNGYVKVINVLLSEEEHKELMKPSDLKLNGFKVTSQKLKAGTRMKSKSQWLNVMNRNVLAYDSVFTTLEF